MLRVGVEPADDVVGAVLGIGGGALVVALRRLRLAGDEPLVVETSFLPAARFPALEGSTSGRSGCTTR